MLKEIFLQVNFNNHHDFTRVQHENPLNWICMNYNDISVRQDEKTDLWALQTFTLIQI